MTVTVGEFEVADPPDAWTRAGFSVDSSDGADAVCRVGSVGIRLVGRANGAAPAATSGSGTGIVGWSLHGLPAGPVDDLDGVPTARSRPGGDIGPRSCGTPATPAAHPNGVIAIDHVVLLSPDLARTVAALGAVGLEPRRERDGELGGRPIRQVFFRLGGVIVEVVGSPDTAGEGPSTLWGLTYVVADFDATVAFLGDRTSPPKDAVQPGRRITTLRHDAFGMSVRTALISPPILGA